MRPSRSESRVPLDLEAILAPFAPNAFFADYWETKPLHIPRRSPDFYRDILKPADVDFIVSTAFELRKDGVDLLGCSGNFKSDEFPREPARFSDVFTAYRRGATIRVKGADRFWQPLWILCRELRREFSFPVRSNLYCSPAGAQGATRHYDTHDVLVLQLGGRKRWRVFNQLVKLPLQSFPALPFERTEDLAARRGAARKRQTKLSDEESGRPIAEYLLDAGDLLYLPRGYVHEAWTEQESSVHLSVGVHALTWLDALAVALGQVGNRVELLRTALPIGFAGEEGESKDAQAVFRLVMEEFARRADMRNAFAEIAAGLVRESPAFGEGVLSELHATFELSPETFVEHRPALSLRSYLEGETVLIVASHGTFSAPRLLAGAVQFIARTRRFQIQEIPGRLSERSKKALVARLIHEGFLRVAHVASRL